MFNVTLTGARELIVRLGEMPKTVHDALLRTVTVLAIKLEARVKEKLTGIVLNVRTGALRRSIFQTVLDQLTSIIGKVASSGDVKYAAIHEFGGRTPAHLIVPSKAQALAFMMDGKQVIVRSVQHPGSQMPERSYLRSSLGDMGDEIRSRLKETVVDAVKP